MGDFNLPGLDWNHGDMPMTVGSSRTVRMFIDLFDSTDLTQWVTQTTFPRSGNTLDLILTSESDRIGRLEVSAPLPGCDHCPTSCEYVFDNIAANNTQESSFPPQESLEQRPLCPNA